jgi:hypothetical protein
VHSNNLQIREIEMLSVKLDTPELVSYVKEFNSEGSRMG